MTNIQKICGYLFGKEVINYGISGLIKKIAGVPQWVPFPAEVHHGWYRKEEPRECDLKSKSPIIMVYNERQKKAWEKRSEKPCYVIGSPFARYRRKEGYQKSDEAKGTLALPMHSGTTLRVEYDVDRYCERLKSLPDGFHPVTVCLHFDDIRRGLDKEYEKNNVSVTTIGHRHDKHFADKFYSLLSEFKYTTSNSLGTAGLYSVEMGVPFFVYSFGYSVVDEKNNSKSDRLEVMTDEEMLFSYSDLSDVAISEKQIDFVINELGLDDAITEKKVRYLILKVFFLTSLVNLFKSMTIRPARHILTKGLEK